MHMADALVSPAVGGTLWAVSSACLAYCSKRVKEDLDERKVPLMGVLGAFVFAAMMINFTIPGTGSSGHLGGGLLLAILLGPHAAFLVIASVLVVQALFFADGGLLALGCNVFNLGFFPAFVAYPLIYRKIIRRGMTPARLAAGTVLAAVAGLQLGAFSVVLETLASGITALPFSTFALLMQPIHLAIGLIEGVVTASIVSFILKANPQILEESFSPAPARFVHARYVLACLLGAAVLTACFLSWYASCKPDGLEWSIAHATGGGEIANDGLIHGIVSAVQDRVSILPDYSFKGTITGSSNVSQLSDSRLGTSLSGLVGGAFTLVLAFLIGFILKKRLPGGS